MTWVVVPPLDPEPWPTLGPEVCDWIEDDLVHGPGDVLGEDVILTEEERLLIYRAFEVFPRNHGLAGRRRFKRVVISRRKGWSKTEKAAQLTIAEMDPTAPVRCDGWRKEGGAWIPVGRPVSDPYIPMVAITEEQTEDLAFADVYAILTHDRCSLVDQYDVNLDRITHRVAPGRIRPLAAAPSAREGALTSFQHFDETHLYTAPRHRAMHETMLRNIPKRPDADAWSLETTTAYAPGDDSIAEQAHHEALDLLAGRIEETGLYFDHRQAAEEHDIETREGLLEALREASGDAWGFTDVESIIRTQFRSTKVRDNDRRRYWLNQPRVSEKTWIAPARWERRANPDRKLPAREQVVLGFKGTYDDSAAALVGCTLDGHLFLIGAWEGGEDYEVPRGEVDADLHEAMGRYRVRRLAWDPPGWYEEGEAWSRTYGRKVAVRAETRKTTSYTAACGKFHTAVLDGKLTHDGSEPLARHLRNASPRKLKDGQYIVADGKVVVAAVAAILAYEQARELGKKAGGSRVVGVTV